MIMTIFPRQMEKKPNLSQTWTLILDANKVWRMNNATKLNEFYAINNYSPFTYIQLRIKFIIIHRQFKIYSFKN